MGLRWVLFGQAGRENGYKNNGSIVKNQNGSVNSNSLQGSIMQSRIVCNVSKVLIIQFD